MPLVFAIDVPVRRTMADFNTLADRMMASPQVRAGAEGAAAGIRRIAQRRGYGFTDRTGRLRRSIRDTPVMRNRDARGRRIVGFTVAVETDLDYAPVVEFGNHGRYSFLRRAVRDGERQAEVTLDRSVDRFIATENRRT